MKKISWYRMTLTLIFLAMIGILIYPILQGKSPIRLGLDIGGGVVVTYRPDFSKRVKSSEKLSESETLQLAKEVIANRLSRALNISPDVVARGDNRVVVSVPSVKGFQDVLQIVGKTYHLTMRLVKAMSKETVEGKKLHEFGDAYFDLDTVAFSGEMLDQSSIKVIPGNPLAEDADARTPRVAFGFDSPFNRDFSRFTATHVGSSLAILLDDSIEVVGRIHSAIGKEGGVLSGKYTLEEAQNHAVLLKSGNMPVALEVESLSGVGPTLGQQVLEQGIIAGLLSILLILLLIIIAYSHRSWFLFGGAASLFVLVMTMGGLAAALDLTLDFAGVAGLILSVGMGVDAFFLVFEDLESRLKRFSPQTVKQFFHQMIQDIYSFAKEGRVLFHSNTTTIITVVLLFFSDRVRYFAVFILLGIAASLYNILVTREVLHSTFDLAPNFGPSLLGWLRGKKPGVFRIWKAYGALTLCLVLFGVFIVWNSLHHDGYLRLGSDFRAGTQVICEARMERDLLAAIGDLSSTISESQITYQKMETPAGTSAQRYLVTIAVPIYFPSEPPTQGGVGGGAMKSAVGGLTDSPGMPVPNEPAAAARALSMSRDTAVTANRLSPVVLERVFANRNLILLSIDVIDNKVSGSRLASSLGIILFSLVLLAFYVFVLQGLVDKIFVRDKSLLYRPAGSKFWVSFGVILSLVHDLCVIVVGCYVLKIDISLSVVAGILTILGYSVNDSVVLWSNIEERAAAVAKSNPGKSIDPKSVVVDSVDAILSRTFLTAVSTMIPALVIILMDITPIKDFAWIMLIGTVAGTLSSYYVLGPFSLLTLRPRVTPVSEGTIAGVNEPAPGGHLNLEQVKDIMNQPR